jgi:predicted anti-sigma-YlaC factor YlaD
MQCASFREAISARLDGEPLGMPERDLETHLAACPPCAAWAEAAAAVTRRARAARETPAPDLTAAVLAAVQRPPEAHAGHGIVLVRSALAVVGVAQAALAWPAIAFGGGAMPAPVHMAHETGAWNLAVAAAFLAVAAAPRLAAGALTFLGTFAALLTALTADDLIGGRVPPERAVSHLLLLAGVGLVAVLAWRGRRRGSASPAVGDRVAA